ncbi:unnamed protein product [Caenorhabditis angaria]|uniref:Uncharacterized protein n=1 Tax=Caenorhabditis angaria TaxID=860376 RepID=A0A9P1MYI4_9PELO|nr:unnamed protein product [Caenorhabditis angaria]
MYESDRERAVYILELLMCELPANSNFGYSLAYGDSSNLGPNPGPNINRNFSTLMQNAYTSYNESGDLCKYFTKNLDSIKNNEPSNTYRYDLIVLIYIYPAMDNCSIYENFKKREFRKIKFFAIHFDDTKSDDYISLNIQHLRNFDLDQKIASAPFRQVVREFSRKILGFEEEEKPEEFVYVPHWTDHLWAPFYILIYLLANFGLVIFIIWIISRRK